MHFDLWITPTFISFVGSLLTLLVQWKRRDWLGIAALIFLCVFLALRVWGHYASYQTWAAAGFALASLVWVLRKS